VQTNWTTYLSSIQQGDSKALARVISLIENEELGYENWLASLPNKNTPIIGITGPPGAGKSTLTDALIGVLISQGKKVAVLCVDPSSPFHRGALLGDRIRMSEWYTNPSVFIRSLAGRGSMGGLHPKIIELTEVIKQAPYDYIIIETVGVGQSEVEIAGLATVTAVVVVPEAGDEIQTMKAGLMEIADLFIVNKSDRPDAGTFVRNLRNMLAPAFSIKKAEIPILQTTATNKTGIEEVWTAIENLLKNDSNKENNYWLMAEKAYYLIERKRMQDIDKNALKDAVASSMENGNFNLYNFIEKYYS
jgi:LAO/AO transport system kinase